MLITEKTFKILFGISISLVMSMLMSFFMILKNVGFIDGFFIIWLKSWAIGLVVGTLAAAVAVPIIQKTLAHFFTISN